MEIGEMIFTIKDENGEETEYVTYFTFSYDDSKSEYIVYTDNTTDTDGRKKLYASKYLLARDVIKLFPIEEDEEWSMVEQAIEEYREQVDKIKNMEALLTGDDGKDKAKPLAK